MRTTRPNHGLTGILGADFKRLQDNNRLAHHACGGFGGRDKEMERPRQHAPFFCINRGGYGFFTSNLICFRMPASFGISAVPAGNLLELKMNERTSTFC